MARGEAFRVLVATDGSAPARAAVATAAAFPWPARTRVRVVVAGGLGTAAPRAAHLAVALAGGFQRVADDARRALARRWPEADAVVVDAPPGDGIVAEARRFRARAVVLGWTGAGGLRRLLGGSVSRAVTRRARCAVLVVKRRPREVRHLLIGVDGSPSCRNAVEFLRALRAPRGGVVTLVRVVEPVTLPSMALLPGKVRAALRSQAAGLAGEAVAGARRELDRAERVLRGAGWAVRRVIRQGAPLEELLAAVRHAGADVLVLGARGVGGMERWLLGSVSEGALARAPVPVLIVR